MRLGHYPERWLKRKLYLDFTDGNRPKYRTRTMCHFPPSDSARRCPHWAAFRCRAQTNRRAADCEKRPHETQAWQRPHWCINRKSEVLLQISGLRD
jgi:hypothetical protein